MQTTRFVPGIVIACALLGCSGGDEAESDTPASVGSSANATTEASGSPAAPGLPPDFTTWDSYAGGAHASQYSSLDEINKETVSTLRVAWTFPSGDANLVFNPIVVGDVMYVLRARGPERDIVALNAATGAELWSNEVEGGVAARGIH